MSIISLNSRDRVKGLFFCLQKVRYTICLVLSLFLFIGPSSSIANHAVEEISPAIRVDSVRLTGSKTIKKGRSQKYTVKWRITRLRDGGRLTPVISLMDKDINNDDELSVTKIIIPEGKAGESHSGQKKMTLNCPSPKWYRKENVRGAEGSSGERKAEVYAWVHIAEPSSIIKVKCVK